MERAVAGGILSREKADEIIGVAAETQVGAPKRAELRSKEEIAGQTRALTREQGSLNRQLKSFELSEEANRAVDKRLVDVEHAAQEAFDKQHDFKLDLKAFLGQRTFFTQRAREREIEKHTALKRERAIAGREARNAELRIIINTEIARRQTGVPGVVTQPSAARALAGAGAPPAGAAQLPQGAENLFDVLARESR
jgi:hypothetical protein